MQVGQTYEVKVLVEAGDGELAYAFAWLDWSSSLLQVEGALIAQTLPPHRWIVGMAGLHSRDGFWCTANVDGDSAGIISGRRRIAFTPLERMRPLGTGTVHADTLRITPLRRPPDGVATITHRSDREPSVSTFPTGTEDDLSPSLAPALVPLEIRIPDSPGG
jgi:hypothetical protein